MKITPTYNYLLIRVHNMPTGSEIELPESAQREPYGEVILTGPDCKVCKVGDKVLYLPANLVAGFDQHKDERFIIPEPAVFGFIDPDMNQDGYPEPKILKNPQEGNHDGR
jgi:hypothetical protein